MKKNYLLLFFIGCVSVMKAQPMQYVSGYIRPMEVTQLSNKPYPVSFIKIKVTGAANPLSVLQFQLSAVAQNTFLGNCNIYYTGTVDSFSTNTLFSTVCWGKQMKLNGEQTLQQGTNYFWLVADNANHQSKETELNFISCTTGLQQYKEVWSDEFDTDGPPDSANWRFEKGFVRNEEDQWYQEENAQCKNGILTIEAKRDSIPNLGYEAGSKDWRRNRSIIRYTSSSINTHGKWAWTYGRIEMRARLDTNSGCWPAWWALGTEGGGWPNNGEIDMMEFYRGKILANYAVGTQKQYNAKWYSTSTAIDLLNNNDWSKRFHNWRMDWDSLGIAIYLDNKLLNYQPQSSLYNRNGNNDYYPFRHPQYMLLNFAIGGQNGGDPSKTVFPRRYEIDYVRVAQKVPGKFAEIIVHKAR